MKKVKLVILFFSLLYIGAANAQENLRRVNFDIGYGANQFIPAPADSFKDIYPVNTSTYSRNILLRFNLNLSYKWSLQLGTNFVRKQSNLASNITGYSYTQKMNANIITVKICNYLMDSAQDFNVYWNMGASYLNSDYNLNEISPKSKQIIYNSSSYLPNVGFEGAIGIRFKVPHAVGFFIEAGLNRMDDKTRAVFQSGISFYFN